MVQYEDPFASLCQEKVIKINSRTRDKHDVMVKCILKIHFLGFPSFTGLILLGGSMNDRDVQIEG
jgi:hypothetical protein